MKRKNQHTVILIKLPGRPSQLWSPIRALHLEAPSCLWLVKVRRCPGRRHRAPWLVLSFSVIENLPSASAAQSVAAARFLPTLAMFGFYNLPCQVCIAILFRACHLSKASGVGGSSAAVFRTWATFMHKRAYSGCSYVVLFQMSPGGDLKPSAADRPPPMLWFEALGLKLSLVRSPGLDGGILGCHEGIRTREKDPTTTVDAHDAAWSPLAYRMLPHLGCRVSVQAQSLSVWYPQMRAGCPQHPQRSLIARTDPERSRLWGFRQPCNLDRHIRKVPGKKTPT
jgi:hypothetical protein